eukprot:Nk52_evm1s553 gene=Nk52_evmTU1s553
MDLFQDSQRAAAGSVSPTGGRGGGGCSSGDAPAGGGEGAGSIVLPGTSDYIPISLTSSSVMGGSNVEVELEVNPSVDLCPFLSEFGRNYALPPYLIPNIHAALETIIGDVKEARQSASSTRSLSLYGSICGAPSTMHTSSSTPQTRASASPAQMDSPETSTANVAGGDSTSNTPRGSASASSSHQLVFSGTQMQLNALLHTWTESFHHTHRKYSNLPSNPAMVMGANDPKASSDKTGSIASATGAAFFNSMGSSGTDAEFSDAYRALMHSPSCSTLLQLEQSYAVAVRELISARESALSQLNVKQNKRTQTILNRMAYAGNSGAGAEAELDRALVKHQEEMEMATVKWASELSVLRDSQRRDYRDFVVNFYKEERERELEKKEELSQGKGKGRNSDDYSLSLEQNPPESVVVDTNDSLGGNFRKRSIDVQKRASSAADSTSSVGALSVAGGWLLGKFMGDSDGESSGGFLNAPSSEGRDGRSRSPSKKAKSPLMSKVSSTNSLQSLSDEVRLEESYTVHLGNQKKSSHNLRLIRDDLIKFCSHDKSSGLNLDANQDSSSFGGAPSSPSKGIVPDAIRAQTSMLLYSFNLSGMVILVPAKVYRNSGTLPDFISLCESSTDFHFPALEIQLEKIREDVMINCRGKLLQCGDFFVTRHSNLAGIHVVFHLIVDDNDCDSSSADPTVETAAKSKLSPRSDVIIGLRNILYVAFNYDIHNLNIPLLMLPSTSSISVEAPDPSKPVEAAAQGKIVAGGNIKLSEKEYLKRCEMVLKCVKGFILENTSSWGYSYKERTIQFLVPVKGTSHFLFQSVSNMLSGIFRMPTPLDLSENA